MVIKKKKFENKIEMQWNLPSTLEIIMIPINIAGRLARKIAHGIAIIFETANKCNHQCKTNLQFSSQEQLWFEWTCHSNGIITT